MTTEQHETRKAITESALSGGGALYPAHGAREIDPEEEAEKAKTPKPLSLRDALSPEKLAAASRDDVSALHGEAHNAWDSLCGGAESWAPRQRGSRAGKREDFQGIPILVEHDKGDVRTGMGKDGREWKREMKWPYGYVTGSVGLDGEPVDVYVGPNAKADTAFVVHQAATTGPGEFGGHDEDKVMLGFGSEHEAREAYHAHMPDARFLGGVTAISIADLKEALARKKPLKKWVDGVRAVEDAGMSEEAFAKTLVEALPAHDAYVEPYAEGTTFLARKSVAPLEVLNAFSISMRVAKANGETRLKNTRVTSMEPANVVTEFDSPSTLHLVDARGQDVSTIGKTLHKVEGKWALVYDPGVASEVAGEAQKLRAAGAHLGFVKLDSGTVGVVANFPFPDSFSSEQDVGKSAEEDDEIEKTIFSSNSSKRSVADKLASVLPAHKTYVEPFVGSAAVFFAKPPSNLEVLSDIDEPTSRAYRAIKNLTASGLSRLDKMDWSGSKATLRRLNTEKPRDEIGFLHKFLYTKRFSIFGFPTAFRVGAEGTISKVVDKVRKFAARLRTAKVLSGDYQKVVEEFDSPDTLYFLDPPYKGKNAAVGEGKWDDERFFNVVSKLKGKVAITLDAHSSLCKRFKDAGYGVRYFTQRRAIANWRPKLGADLWQALIANYALPEKEWLKNEPPPAAVAKAKGKMSPEDVTSAHTALAMEIVRRGMPHDSLLPPLLPDRSEEHGLGEEHADTASEGESDERIAWKALAKKAGVNEDVARRWLASDAEEAQRSPQAFPSFAEGEEGSGALVTVERGLTDDQAAEGVGVAWEPQEDLVVPGAPHGVVEQAKAGDAVPLRAHLSGATAATAKARVALATVSPPPSCSTVVMYQRKGAWEGVRVASPGAQFAGSGFLAVARGVSKGLVDARGVSLTPTDALVKDNDGTWTRTTVQGGFRWKAGRQSATWSEVEHIDGPGAGRYAFATSQIGPETAVLMRRVDDRIEKRATLETEIVEVSKREDKRIVTGVVLQPEVTDGQLDIMSVDEIEKSAHNFVANYGKPGGTRLGFMHRDFSRPFELVESWIAPQDLTLGGKKILKGTWVMSVRVLDEEVWRGIKNGKFKGFSIGGVARVQRLR